MKSKKLLVLVAVMAMAISCFAVISETDRVDATSSTYNSGTKTLTLGDDISIINTSTSVLPGKAYFVNSHDEVRLTVQNSGDRPTMDTPVIVFVYMDAPIILDNKYPSDWESSMGENEKWIDATVFVVYIVSSYNAPNIVLVNGLTEDNLDGNNFKVGTARYIEGHIYGDARTWIRDVEDMTWKYHDGHVYKEGNFSNGGLVGFWFGNTNVQQYGPWDPVKEYPSEQKSTNIFLECTGEFKGDAHSEAPLSDQAYDIFQLDNFTGTLAQQNRIVTLEAWTGGNLTITKADSDHKVILNGGLTIPEGSILTIRDGTNATALGTVSLKGSIIKYGSGNLTGGTITNSSPVTDKKTITLGSDIGVVTGSRNVVPGHAYYINTSSDVTLTIPADSAIVPSMNDPLILFINDDSGLVTIKSLYDYGDKKFNPDLGPADPNFKNQLPIIIYQVSSSTDSTITLTNTLDDSEIFDGYFQVGEAWYTETQGHPATNAGDARIWYNKPSENSVKLKDLTIWKYGSFDNEGLVGYWYRGTTVQQFGPWDDVEGYPSKQLSTNHFLEFSGTFLGDAHYESGTGANQAYDIFVLENFTGVLTQINRVVTIDSWTGGNITITKANSTYAVLIKNGLSIPEGSTLTLNDGTYVAIGDGVTLTNNGTIAGSGTLSNGGTLVNKAGTASTIACTLTGSGTYQLIIPAKTDAVYKGTNILAFELIPTGIGDETVTLTYTTYAADAGKVQTYTYEATPSASGKFTVAASDSSASREFTIASAGDLTIGKASLDDVTLALTSDSGQYTGDAQNPGFTVKIGDQDVSSDFNAASWPEDMINAGSKTLTLTSKNENIVSGNKTATYTITQAENEITAVTIAGWTYGANPSVPTTTAAFGGTTATYLYKLTSAGEGAYSSTVPTDAGAYDIKATIAETSNYKGATGTATFTIAPLSITGATVTLGDALTYNGSAQTQTVTKITVSTVEYNIGTGLAVSDNVQTNVKTDGDYTLTVTGSGNFTGSATKTWNISPLSVSTLDVTIKNGDATITPGERIAYEEAGYTLTYAVDGYASPATIASKWQIKNGETWTDTDTIKNSGEYQLVLTGSANFTGTQAFAGPVIAEAKEIEHVDETTHKTTEDATVTADTDSVSISNDSEFTVGDDKKVEINLQTTFDESGSDGKAKIEFPEGTVFNEGNESSVISLVNITPADPEAAPTFEIVFENVTVITVTITLPVGTGLTNPAVYYVPGGSAEKVLMGGTYDAVAGTITFTTTHNSTYEVQQSETPVTHTVNITAGSGGTVSQTTVTGVADNASISASGSTLTIGTTTVTATASSRYTFANWSGIPASGKVTEDLNIKANFTSSPGPTPPGPGPGPSPTITYTLTFEAGAGGSVSPATVKAAINANISVNGDTMIIGTGTSAKTVKAIPNDGYTVGTWSVTSGKVTSDMTISVTFKKVSLTEISVKNAPTKVSYKEGEKFDPAGLSIMLKYDDMTFKVLPYKGNESQFSFSPSLATPLKISDKTVTITFEGKSTTQAITVSGDSPSGGNDNTVLYVVIAALVVIFAAGAVFYFVKKKPAE